MAGLRAARVVGIPTGGWMPLGYRTADGPRPEYRDLYGMVETETAHYVPRTRLNAREADVTVRLAYNWMSPGERATKREVLKAGRTLYDVEILRRQDGLAFDREPEALAFALNGWVNPVVNIAGNADPWIEEAVEEFLVAAFREYALLSTTGLLR